MGFLRRDDDMDVAIGDTTSWRRIIGRCVLAGWWRRCRGGSAGFAAGDVGGALLGVGLGEAHFRGQGT